MAWIRYRIKLSIILFFARKSAAEANSCRIGLADPEVPAPRLSLLQHPQSQRSVEVLTALTVGEEVEKHEVISANASTQNAIGLVLDELRSLRKRIRIHVQSLTEEPQVSTTICVLLMAIVAAMLCIVWLFSPEADNDYWVDVMPPLETSSKMSPSRLPHQGNMFLPPSCYPSPRAHGRSLGRGKSLPALGSPATTPVRASLAQLRFPSPRRTDNLVPSPRTLASSASVPAMLAPPGSPCLSPPLTPSSQSRVTPPQITVTPQATPPLAGRSLASQHLTPLRSTPQATPPLAGWSLAGHLTPIRSTPQVVGHIVYEGQGGNRLLVPRLNLP